MDKFNTHQVTMGIKKSIKQQNSKQKRHIAPKSKEFRSWILRKVIDNGKNNSLNIWILDDPKIWGTHLNRREVVMSCSVWISEASGGWCSCSTICLTSGLVTFIGASYSEYEVTTGSVNPRPPMRTGRPRRSRSALVTVWLVTAGKRTSLTTPSSGSKNSAISGNVLRKYVQQCRRPKVKAA